MYEIPHLMQAVLAETADTLLQLVQVSTPNPGPSEVLLRVEASGANPLDAKILAGMADHAQQPLPAILGIDVAGVVVGLGEAATKFRIGDAVYGMAGGIGGRSGSLAEYMVADEKLLALKPGNFSMREAAALPLVFITAWEGLVDRAAISAGQHLLVQGGAGGVGQMVLQIAAARGAHLAATGSTGARSAIERLGAKFVDRTEPAFNVVERLTDGLGFDVIFDTSGGASLDASFAMVRHFGHVVSALGWGTHSLAPLSFRAASYSGIFTLQPLLTGEGTAHYGEILRQATELAEDGRLMPGLDPRHFDFSTVGDAYRALTDGTARGKLIIEIASGA